MKAGEIYFMKNLAKKLAGKEFEIFVEDRNGNELYVVDNVEEANFHQVMVKDIYESPDRVEVAVVDLDWEEY